MLNVAYLLALHSIDGLGPVRLKSLLDKFQDPKIIWEINLNEIKGLIPDSVIERFKVGRNNLNPNEYKDKIEKDGIKYKTIYDGDYPKGLKEIYDPPLVFYYKGEFLPEDEKALAVVGTRKITGYGRSVTETFTKALVEAGFTIVSGLARGVDSVAHWSAVRANGRTIAVLGGGLNNIYPPENIGLVDQIIWGKGAVLSEFPPDYPSLPGNFPARNRIISGLSKGVLVTEAAVDSGSLITARVALEQGRDVFAIPGPVTSQLSKGPADLIKEGARLVFEPDDILEEMGIDQIKMPVQNLGNLSKEEQLVLGVLENEEKHIDEICREIKLNASIVSASLLKMEIIGVVRNLGGGVYCKG